MGWLAMAQQPEAILWSTGNDDSFVPPHQRSAPKKISVEEITETFELVSEDIAEIGKLTNEENTVFSAFIASLKNHLEPLKRPIEVSAKIIPIDLGVVSQAYILPSGELALTFTDGKTELIDLNKPQHRDLMLSIVKDVLPKLEAIIHEIEESNRRRNQPAPEPQIEPPKQAPALIIVEPTPVPPVAAEPPISLAEPVPAPEPKLIPESEPPIDPTVKLLRERNAKIEAITTETITYLETLGNEVFEQEPVSKYFDDWMVNLRQVILFYETNEAIGVDETFNAQYTQILRKVQEELDNRVALEGDLAVSLRTLVENRYLLNKIDEEEKAQTKEFVEKGANQIESLMHRIANLEKELAETQAIKVSYLHPMQMMVKEQRIHELTQKLNQVKQQLAMAVSSSSTGDSKAGDVNAQFEAQVKILEEKRRIAMEMLNKNIKDIYNEIAKLKMIKTSNPIKKLSIQQQIFELEQKLQEAKTQLELAERNSSNELQKLKEEFEKKKQAALGKVQTLEKDIAKKSGDTSAGVRKEATDALIEAVKALSAKRLAEPLSTPKQESAQN